MHQQDTSTEILTQAILRYAVERIRMDPPTLDGPKPEATLRAMTGKTITIEGMGDSKHYASSPMSSLLLVSLSITPDFFLSYLLLQRKPQPCLILWSGLQVFVELPGLRPLGPSLLKMKRYAG